MSFSARFLGRIAVFLTLFIFFFTIILPTPVSAETSTSLTNNVDSSIDENVSMNIHTLTQTIMIEMAAASICQLAGIDLINPNKSCLGINTQTNKIGYSPSSQQPQQLGGVVGAATGMIAGLYTPTTSSVGYIHYVAQNFGITKKAYAATDGFQALWPVMDLWRLIRNIAYFFLILIFIFIGIGVMLRINIDPRTVMTVQNQLPRIVMGILLITLSYAIAAVMIDVMWISTYVGINAITQSVPPSNNKPVKGCGDKPDQTISQVATNNLLETPITYVNQTYSTTCILGSTGGIWNLTTQISGSLGGMLKGIIDSLAGKHSRGCVYFFGVDIASCLSGVIGFIGTIIMFLIILAVILYALFRIWFSLLRAYIYTIVYVIMAPLWIVAGLLPQKPLGFGAWWRSLFANLAVFPVTAWLLVFGRVIMDKYNETDRLLKGGAMNGFPGISQVFAQPANLAPDQVQNYYVPPLVGNSFAPDFGALIALGILLLTPNVGDMLKNALKAPDLKSQGTVGKGIAVGAGVVGAATSKPWAALNKRNAQTGGGEGVVSRNVDIAKKKLAGNIADKWRRGDGKPLPGRKLFSNYAERVTNQQAGYGRVTNAQREEVYNTQGLLNESTRSGMDPKQLQTAARQSGIPLNAYLTEREGARREVEEARYKGQQKDFEQVLAQRIEQRKNPQARQEPNTQPASGPGGPQPWQPNQGGQQQDQQGGQQQNPNTPNVQIPRTLNIEGVDKVIISGPINLDSAEVKQKTPEQHVTDLIPGSGEEAVKLRDKKIEALKALQQGGENWVTSSPIGSLGSMSGNVMDRFEQFMKTHFTTEEPPTGNA